MPTFGGQASRQSVRKGSSTVKLDEEKEKKPEDKKEEEKKEVPKVEKSRIMKFYGPPVVKIFSVIVPFFAAFGFPAFGFLFTRLTFVLMQPQKDSYRRDVDFYSLIFLGACVFMGLTRFLTKYLYTIGGENCTFGIRKAVFESIIHKQVWWFDS